MKSKNDIEADRKSGCKPLVTRKALRKKRLSVAPINTENGILTMLLKEKIFTLFCKSRNILLFEIGLYLVLFSFFSISRYYSFNTYAYDLGVYNQALHSTLFGGKVLYSTADLLANPSGSLFGIHFSPIFFVILPIYAIHADPTMLLFLQSLALSLGALPLYLIASKRLGSEKWGLVFATLYLLNPALQGVNWYDFHPEAFLPLFFLLSLYFLDSKKTGKYFASVLLALMTIEFASIVFIFMSLYFMAKLKPWKRSQVDRSRMKILLATIVLAIVWLIVSLQVINAFNPSVRPMTGETYWREIGATSLLDLPGQAIAHPDRVIQALSFDGTQKISFILVLLGSVAFLPLLEPWIAVCLPSLLMAFLSNYPPFYEFGDQYAAFIIPFLFYGAVVGLQRVKASKKFALSKKKAQVILGILLCFSVILFFFVSPLNGGPYQSVNWFSYGFPEISQHDRNVLKLLEQVPPDASVLTQNDIFPLLSNRPNAHVFPSGVFYPPGESFNKVLSDMLNKVDFIVGDLETDNIVFPTLLHYASINGSFGLYAAADGAVILKRGYSDIPVVFLPVRLSFNYNSFILVDGSTLNDPESESGRVLRHSTINKSLSLFWVGPYAFLPPGDYEATFRIKTDSASEENLLELYVSCFLYKVSINYLGSNASGYHLRFNLYTGEEQKIQASRKLNASDFSGFNRYQEFPLRFTVNDFGAYEFRGTALSNSSNIFFDNVRIVQIRPSANLNLEIQEVFPKS